MCLEDALDTVRVAVGIEAFNEIFTGDPSTVIDSAYLDTNLTSSDETALRLSRVTRAVYYFSLAEVVLNTNLRIRPSGLVKKEQDSGSPAVSVASQVENEYLSPKETREYADWLTGKGNELVGAYIIDPGPPSPYGQGSLVRG